MHAEEYLRLSDEEKLSEIDKRLQPLASFVSANNETSEQAKGLVEMLETTKSEIEDLKTCSPLMKIVLAQMAKLTIYMSDKFIAIHHL